MNPTHLPKYAFLSPPICQPPPVLEDQTTNTPTTQGPTNPLTPPTRTTLPLWLALLLKRQRRINIIPPPWLDNDSLREILDLETTHYQDEFSPASTLPDLDNNSTTKRSRQNPGNIPATLHDVNGKPIHLSPPFTSQCTATTSTPATSLPYHWYEFSQLLLDSAPDDLAHPDQISNLIRDIREVRQAKLRRGYSAITDGSEGVRLDGVGAMEVAESRGFVMGVMKGLAMVGGSREAGRGDEEAARGSSEVGDEDEEME